MAICTPTSTYGGRRFPGGMDADFDIFNGSEDELRQFLVACVPPPGPGRSPSPPPG